MKQKRILKSCLATLIGLGPYGCGFVSDSGREDFVRDVTDVIVSPGPSYDLSEPSIPDDVDTNGCGSLYPFRVVYHHRTQNRDNLLCNPFEDAKVLEGATIKDEGFGLDSGLILEWDHKIDRVYVSFDEKPCSERFGIFPFERVDYMRFKVHQTSSKWPNELPSIDGPFIPISNENIDLHSNYPGTDYKLYFDSSTRYVGIFNFSSEPITLSVIKSGAFSFGANASCDLPDYIYDPPDDDGYNPPEDDYEPPAPRGDCFVDKVSHGGSNVLGAPDRVYSYIGFGDLIEASFTDNIPKNGFGSDIRVYTETVPYDIEYNVLVHSGGDFVETSGILYTDSKNIEMDISGLSGDYSNMSVAVLIDPRNQAKYDLGIDAIKALYNE